MADHSLEAKMNFQAADFKAQGAKNKPSAFLIENGDGTKSVVFYEEVVLQILQALKDGMASKNKDAVPVIEWVESYFKMVAQYVAMSAPTPSKLKTEEPNTAS